MKKFEPQSMTIAALAVLAVFAFPKSSLAHEYWLEPMIYQVESGSAMEGNLKNGQDFKGSNFSYINGRFESFTYTGPQTKGDVSGRSGDIPALSFVPEETGLFSISYQGNFDRITFTDPAKLKHYVEYEGLDGVLERHIERGHAENKFEEQYARCAKALFQVGDPAENARTDSYTGMKYELVAEKNPYLLNETDMFPVQLLWEGKPIANKQIRMFRFNGELTTMILRTNEEGRAEFPLTGGGKFMLNSVNIYEGDDDPETKTAEWISYWASMVFGIKGSDELLKNVSATTK